jgi:hypothetical protein
MSLVTSHPMLQKQNATAKTKDVTLSPVLSTLKGQKKPNICTQTNIDDHNRKPFLKIIVVIMTTHQRYLSLLAQIIASHKFTVAISHFLFQIHR